MQRRLRPSPSSSFEVEGHQRVDAGGPSGGQEGGQQGHRGQAGDDDEAPVRPVLTVSPLGRHELRPIHRLPRHGASVAEVGVRG